jgi:GNAT superfamily N-acetyltransferase
MRLRDDTVMNWRIRQAGVEDLDAVSSVLHEAAQWLEQRGMALWRDSELAPDRIREEVEAGLFHVAEADGIIGGVIMFQLEDPEFWPDAVPGEAAYLHRLAVRRRFAGGQVSSLLLDWSREKTQRLGRKYLRMDTETPRFKLREMYERYGFQYHSERDMGRFSVIRYQYPIDGRVRRKVGSKK